MTNEQDLAKQGIDALLQKHGIADKERSAVERRYAELLIEKGNRQLLLVAIADVINERPNAEF